MVLPVPPNVIAVSFRKFFALLYTDSNGFVSWVNYVGLESAANAPQYATHNAIQANAKATVTAYPGQVALVIFYDREPVISTTEVHFRLYYIQKGSEGNFPDKSVRELAAFTTVASIDNGSATLKWWRGDPTTGATPKPSAFDAKNYVAAQDSPLAAASDGKTIRVYFQRASSNDLTVAYAENNNAKSSTLTWNERVAAIGSAL